MSFTENLRFFFRTGVMAEPQIYRELAYSLMFNRTDILSESINLQIMNNINNSEEIAEKVNDGNAKV